MLSNDEDRKFLRLEYPGDSSGVDEEQGGDLACSCRHSWRLPLAGRGPPLQCLHLFSEIHDLLLQFLDAHLEQSVCRWGNPVSKTWRLYG